MADIVLQPVDPVTQSGTGSNLSYSAVDVANLAIVKCGATRISSFTDESKQAREVNFLFPLKRDSLLRRFEWNFSLIRTTLAAEVDAPEWGFAYQYPLPNDCLRVVQIGEYFPALNITDAVYRDSSEYKFEGRYVLTDFETPLKIRYVSSVDDVGRWDPLFIEALACYIAVDLCVTLAQSMDMRQSLKQDYQRAILDAVKVNAIERPPQATADDSWVAARW